VRADEDRRARLAHDAEGVADEVRKLLVGLIEHHGFATSAVLAGAHGEIVTMMAVELGGKVAAEAFERAAERVRDMPSRADWALAVAPTAGRA